MPFYYHEADFPNLYLDSVTIYVTGLSICVYAHGSMRRHNPMDG